MDPAGSEQADANGDQEIEDDEGQERGHGVKPRGSGWAEIEKRASLATFLHRAGRI
jgi:hypothetical protein